MASQTPIITEQPLVSVIMSVYNGERFLQQAVDSILQQTYSNWEFIIIDDNSTDLTASILSGYSDERIRVLKNDQQLGLTQNLNAAVEISTGEFIARMDADDISLPLRLEKQVKYLKNAPLLAGVAGFIEFIDENGSPSGIWKHDRQTNTASKIRALLPWENCIAHPTVMLRRNVISRYKYNIAQKHSQDWDLWLRLFANDLALEKLNEVVLQYRLHTSSVTYIQKKQSAFKKKNEIYRRYFASAGFKWNMFNLKVYSCYLVNKLMLHGSNIKRKLK